MSQENVELFKKALDAYNQRDVQTMLKLLEPRGRVVPVHGAGRGGRLLPRSGGPPGMVGQRGWHVRGARGDLPGGPRPWGLGPRSRAPACPLQKRRAPGDGDRLAHLLPGRSWSGGGPSKATPKRSKPPASRSRQVASRLARGVKAARGVRTLLGRTRPAHGNVASPRGIPRSGRAGRGSSASIEALSATIAEVARHWRSGAVDT
jgi:hypothetical protein